MDDRPTGEPDMQTPSEDGAGGADLGPLSREFYFPTPIFFRDFPGVDGLNDQLTRRIRALRQKDSVGLERSNVASLGGWHSHDALQNDPGFDGITNRIVTTANDIADTSGYDPAWQLELDNMWAIINPPRSYNRAHVHPGSLWSGVYYVRAPKDAGKIVFFDPRNANVMIRGRYDPNKQLPPEHWVEVYFEPIPGRLVMFPSWLVHAVDPNLNEGEGEDAERICISFNLFSRKKG